MSEKEKAPKKKKKTAMPTESSGGDESQSSESQGREESVSGASVGSINLSLPPKSKLELADGAAKVLGRLIDRYVVTLSPLKGTADDVAGLREIAAQLKALEAAVTRLEVPDDEFAASFRAHTVHLFPAGYPAAQALAVFIASEGPSALASTFCTRLTLHLVGKLLTPGAKHAAQRDLLDLKLRDGESVEDLRQRLERSLWIARGAPENLGSFLNTDEGCSYLTNALPPQVRLLLGTLSDADERNFDRVATVMSKALIQYRAAGPDPKGRVAGQARVNAVEARSSKPVVSASETKVGGEPGRQVVCFNCGLHGHVRDRTTRSCPYCVKCGAKGHDLYSCPVQDGATAKKLKEAAVAESIHKPASYSRVSSFPHALAPGQGATAAAATLVAERRQPGRVYASSGSPSVAFHSSATVQTALDQSELAPSSPSSGDRGAMAAAANEAVRRQPSQLYAPHMSSVAATSSAVVQGPADHRRVWVEVLIGGRRRTVCADPAATHSVVGLQDLDGCQYTRAIGDHPVRAFDGHELVVTGKAFTTVSVGSASVKVAFLIVPGAPEILLGADALNPLGVMEVMASAFTRLGAVVVREEALPLTAAAVSAINFPDDVYEPASSFAQLDLSHIDEDLREGFRAALIARRRAFCRAECLPPACKAEPVKLVLKQGAGGPAVMKQRPWSPETRDQHYWHEQRRLKYDTAMVVTDTPLYERRAEPLLVWKPDGTTRQVVDESLVNPQFVIDPYPIPLIPEQLAKFYGFLRGSKFDLAEGYVQVRLDPESWVHTTFRTTTGLMVSKRLLAGLSPAPGNFCRAVRMNLIDRLPADVRDSFACYFDDMGHGTRADTDRAAQEAEIASVLQFLDVCIEGGHTLRLHKCTFVAPKLAFAGVELKQGMRRPIPERINSIVNFAPIETKKDLHRFVCMGEPWRTWIPDFFSISAPLRAAAAGRGPLSMSPLLRTQIEVFKQRFASLPYAWIPNQRREFDLYVDASAVALGFILEQENHFVASGGRRLTRREGVLPSYDREWLAVVEGLEKSEIFTGGARVHVHSDHETLRDLGVTERDMSGPRAVYYERSMRFKYDVTYLQREHPKMMAVDAITKSPEFREQIVGTPSQVPVKPQNSGAVVEPIVASVTKPKRPLVVERIAELVETAPRRTEAAVWRERQLRYAPHALLINFKEKGELPADITPARAKGLAALAQHFEIVDGALYHIQIVKGGQLLIQLAVPDVDNLRQERLRIAHEVESAHEAPQKLFERVRRWFFWETLLADCKAYYEACDPCMKHKSMPTNIGLLDPTTTAKLRGKRRFFLDMMGPFEADSEGYAWVTVAIDAESGRPYLWKQKDATAASVIAGMREHLVPHAGVPESLVTDRARNLNAEVCEAIYKAFGIEKLTTSAYNPQADGMAENLVKSVKHKLAVLQEAKGGHWSSYLGEVLTSIHSMFKMPNAMSPFKAEHGREMILPSYFDTPLADLGVDQDPMVRDLKEIQRIIHERRDKAAEDLKKQYDKGRVSPEYAVGDLVWIRNHTPDSSLDAKKVGPYRITEIIGDLDVRVAEIPQGPQLGQRHDVVNVKHVELYKGSLKGQDLDDGRVVNIIKHRIEKRKSGRIVKYYVQWSDGSFTWEPLRHLVDLEGREYIFVDVLLEYWKKRPHLKDIEPLPSLPVNTPATGTS